MPAGRPSPVPHPLSNQSREKEVHRARRRRQAHDHARMARLQAGGSVLQPVQDHALAAHQRPQDQGRPHRTGRAHRAGVAARVYGAEQHLGDRETVRTTRKRPPGAPISTATTRKRSVMSFAPLEASIPHRSAHETVASVARVMQTAVRLSRGCSFLREEAVSDALDGCRLAEAVRTGEVERPAA